MFLTETNCYFYSTVKNTNVPQNKFLRHRLVLTGTICKAYTVIPSANGQEIRGYPELAEGSIGSLDWNSKRPVGSIL